MNEMRCFSVVYLVRVATTSLLSLILGFNPSVAQSDGKPVENSNFCPVSHELVETALADALHNFWDGNPETGHISNTWSGYTSSHGALHDPRGGLWERGTLYNFIYQMDIDTPSRQLKRRLEADWAYVKSVFTVSDFSSCGAHSVLNFASDDAAMNALYFIQASHVTQDRAAIKFARSALTCALSRWEEPSTPGGLWYDDKRKTKSLYEVILVEDFIQLYEMYRNPDDLKSAKRLYEWLEGNLLRPDGLYWANIGSDGPIGKERPDDIGIAGSVSFLGGNFAIAAVHAWLYKETQDPIYKARAERTAKAIRSHYATQQNAVLINDRDAWMDGVFAPIFAKRVTALFPEISINLRDTAVSIVRNSKTLDRYYAAEWSGKDPKGHFPWQEKGSLPSQIMTTSNSISMVLSGAISCRQAP